ncbi:MAG: hypothetical protein NC548_62840 [Lachnospiraceae bacterium]|nr:hypothetical protein [Lachnospiraceae bacterium]
MKTKLTTDQSSRLIELGIDERKASKEQWFGRENFYCSIFSLADLLALLPKWIKHRHYLCYLEMGVDRYEEHWYACYKSDQDCDEAGSFQSAEELIDCLYEMLIFLIENNLYEVKK